MIKPNTFYKFKTEFAKELNIPNHQVDRRQEQGEDVSEEKSFFKKAQERFIEKYSDFAVLVSRWRLNPSLYNLTQRSKRAAVN